MQAQSRVHIAVVNGSDDQETFGTQILYAYRSYDWHKCY